MVIVLSVKFFKLVMCFSLALVMVGCDTPGLSELEALCKKDGGTTIDKVV